MTTLFRKHRPQTFSNLVGQDLIITTLTNELKNNSFAQAYLFFGPRGTGKTTTARLFAKAINCQNRKPGSAEPCDTCSSCKEIANGRNVDVIEIDAASQTGVDNVRENIIENAQFKPTKSPRKIFIIDEVHMLSTSAFNALLKTLEEPPSHIVFILATTELHKLPATIVSRCQRFIFKKIPHDIMQTRLKKIAQEEGLQIDNEVLERIIDKSDGALRDAESLLGQISTLAKDSIITVDSVDLVLPAPPFGSALTLLDFLSQKDGHSALNHVAQLAQTGISADYFLAECLEALRIILHILVTKKIPAHNRILGDNHIKLIQKISGNLAVSEAIKLLDITLKRRQDSRFSPIPELPIDLLVVEYCSSSQEKDMSIATTTTPPSLQIQTPSTQKIDVRRPEKDVIPNSSHLTVPPQSTTPGLDKKKDTPSTITVQTISREALQAHWKKIIEWVGSKSHSLTFILNTTKISRIEGERVFINVPYDFHREKLMESKNKKLLEQGMQEITGVPLFIQCDVSGESTTDMGSLNALAASFGGEIVAT